MRMDEGISFTKDQLEYALIRILGSQTYYTMLTNKVTIPNIAERAARQCFVYREEESNHTRIIRQALYNLDTRGEFLYAPVE